ncbi:MAG: hypothetical protein HC906_18820 [Bacteroidales bacterium]|nr:hypothetical protein [Bacteroidales bacterium]
MPCFGFSTGNSYNIGFFGSGESRFAVISGVKQGRWSKELYGFGPDSYNTVNICSEITKLKQQNIPVFIFIHWGTELIEVPDEQDILNAHKFIDAGALAVIGHHPHVCQGMEYYKSGFIAYSLGSFIYVHEDETGFSANDKSRFYSICLTLEIENNQIFSDNCTVYKYNTETKLPEKLDDSFSDQFMANLSKNINNRELYKQQN